MTHSSICQSEVHCLITEPQEIRQFILKWKGSPGQRFSILGHNVSTIVGESKPIAFVGSRLQTTWTWKRRWCLSWQDSSIKI